jgi:hypothetical protein
MLYIALQPVQTVQVSDDKAPEGTPPQVINLCLNGSTALFPAFPSFELALAVAGDPSRIISVPFGLQPPSRAPAPQPPAATPAGDSAPEATETPAPGSKVLRNFKLLSNEKKKT